jgi:hypothetical protein
MSSDLSPEEMARSHRFHAVECNNLAWSLAELSHRSSAQDAEMLHAAHAAAYHWGKVGTALNAARADMLLGHVHAALGHGELALRYATASYEYLMVHDPPDWERAFAHAVLAYAAFAAGERSLHGEHYAKAKELGEQIAGTEDRDIFLKTFRLVPAPP